MMSSTFNYVYVNAILTVSMDITPAYLLDGVIGVVETLATNLDF